MNKYCFPYENGKGLTLAEESARDMMVNLFNPVLKFLFLSYNEKEFKKYGFNSCRQTAILGSYFVKMLLPEYEVKAFEGNFTEYEEGIKENYIHAFITAQNGNRKLIIDLSRTTKRLLFHPAFSNLYPTKLDYGFVQYHDCTELDTEALLDIEGGEYYTSKKPRELLITISNLMNDLKNTSDKGITFRDAVYQRTTNILRR